MAMGRLITKRCKMTHNDFFACLKMPPEWSKYISAKVHFTAELPFTDKTYEVAERSD